MKAKILVNKSFTEGEIDRRLYGSFIEHLGRAVYTGIYEPGHESADEDGFRKDVIELVKELNVPIVRYPGGNFVSGYNWEDGIGDKSKRPKRAELAWESIETNEVGIDEFQKWAKLADSSVMMAVNLGTRGPEEAKNCLEYCNSTRDTYYANLRRENGFEEPFDIKVWCLGNEMDGPWQICHKTADEYGRAALETAKLMKLTDPSVELVVCGSSGYYMNTFGDWELTVLDHTYEYADYISLHTYFGNHEDNAPEFLAQSMIMDEFIKSVIAICDAVKAKKHSQKTVNLSFDEWNVWFHTHGEKVDKWQVAPPILEDIYNFEDALVVGCMLMVLQNHSSRVKMACLAQLVNVIAPIMTVKGGKAWVQTIFYPFMYSSKYGNGTTLKPIIESDKYDSKNIKDVPYLETSVIDNHDNRELVVFAVNRSLDEDMEFEIATEKFGKSEIIEHIELYSDDLKTVNTPESENVKPVNIEVNKEASEIHTVNLKKHSWNMIRIKY